MKVQQIIQNLKVVKTVGDLTLLNKDIKDLSYSTRDVDEDKIFFGLVGRTIDGASFIPQAYEKGCRIYISQTEVPIKDGSLLIIVEDGRKALSAASAQFFGNPTHDIKVVGITGTKGKTSTSTLLYKIMNEIGYSAGVIGTNGVFFAGEEVKTHNTTPESYELHRILRMMVDKGVKVCFIEVSSQGLMMSRVEDVTFAIGVYTNLSNDHIGGLEHPTFEDYQYWKTHLMDLTQVALVNEDDAHVDAFKAKNPPVLYTYGIDKKADYQAENMVFTRGEAGLGMTFDYVSPTGTHQDVVLGVPGKFSVYNGLVVLTVAQLLGQDVEKVKAALVHTSVPGRMEVIPTSNQVMAILDYAHNGFSLENVILTLKEYEYNRIIVMFGAGGDRPKIRRKELGDVVAKYADVALITSDNPRTEDPEAIIADIQQSFVGVKRCEVITEISRREAIKLAAEISQPGDIIVFAGKGHEDYQILKSATIPFYEREYIREAFN